MPYAHLPLWYSFHLLKPCLSSPSHCSPHCDAQHIVTQSFNRYLLASQNRELVVLILKEKWIHRLKNIVELAYIVFVE